LNTCSVPSVVSRRSVCVAMSVTYMSPPRSKPSMVPSGESSAVRAPRVASCSPRSASE